jgi:hypothetical protein
MIIQLRCVTMWVVVTVVAVVVLVATYLTWTAARVDRLHARAAAAFSALDAQSVRRAAAAAELAERQGFVDLEAAARAVLVAHPDDREAAENDLTHALRTAVAKTVEDAPLAGVVEANRRLSLARQVHNDLVRDALALRRQRWVRLLRLTRRHPQPRFFDIDEPTLDDTQDPRQR